MLWFSFTTTHLNDKSMQPAIKFRRMTMSSIQFRSGRPAPCHHAIQARRSTSHNATAQVTSLESNCIHIAVICQICFVGSMNWSPECCLIGRRRGQSQQACNIARRGREGALPALNFLVAVPHMFSHTRVGESLPRRPSWGAHWHSPVPSAPSCACSRVMPKGKWVYSMPLHSLHSPSRAHDLCLTVLAPAGMLKPKPLNNGHFIAPAMQSGQTATDGRNEKCLTFVATRHYPKWGPTLVFLTFP